MNPSSKETPRENHQPPAEHRLVTILFADVVGSTALTGEVEAETSRLILDRCLRTMSQAVDEFGGTVARLMGDGLLAFFGAPTAHEDDPERAALTALEIHAAVGRYGGELDISLKVRIGINTGRVVMGEVGGELLSEYTAMGQPINLAARLQSSAEPGATLIGETTYRLITHRFETQAIPPLKLKGFEKEVTAFQLLKQRQRSEPARGIPGMISPLIGRDKELAKLVSLLNELESGRGAITALIGEPGIGKSRLLHEARQRGDDLPVTWAEGRASSYTSGQPFSVIRDLLGELLKLNALDKPAMIDLKIERELTPLFDERLGEIWPPIALLLGAPAPPNYAHQLEGLEPDALNRSMTTAFCQLVEAMASKQPMVLAFDDLHWADPSSLNLIEALFLATERVPLLIVLLFRPDHDSRIWELKSHAERDFGHRYLELPLDPLSQGESREMVARLLSNDALPETLHQLLLEKSEGNPFFLEELLQDLIESGDFTQEGKAWKMARDVHRLRVPETLQEVIQARVDRLPAPARSTLQSAAVIGRRFGLPLLEAITPHPEDLPSHLLTLQRADLIREWSRQPEPTYDFKLSAVQEVTYQQLLAEQRGYLHQKVAESLETMFAERLDEHAAVLAYHFSLTEDKIKALSFHRMAGDEAFRVNANLEAAEHYTTAIELSQDDQNVPIDELSHLYLSLGRAYELTAQYDLAMSVYTRLRELAEGCGEPGIALRALLAKTTLQVTPTPLFDAVLGRHTAEEALQLARDLHDPQAEAKTLWVIGMLGRLTGQDSEAIGPFEESLAIAEKHDLQEQIAYTLTDLYWSYLVKENMEMPRRTVDRAHQIWVNLSNFPMMVDTLAGKVFILFLSGEYREAMETAAKAWELSQRIDNLWGKAYSKLYTGMVQTELGEIGPAFETMQQSIELGIQAGFFIPGAILPGFMALAKARVGLTRSPAPVISDTIPNNFRQIVSPFVELIEAQIHIFAGDLERARLILGEIAGETAMMSSLYLANPVALTQASFADAVGDHDQVLDLTTAAIQSQSERGILTHLPMLHYLRAKALKHTDQGTEALEQINQGLRLTSESGARWPAWQLLALRARLRGETGEIEPAREDWRAAAAIIGYIADHIGEEQLQQSFLKRLDVTAIIEQVD